MIKRKNEYNKIKELDLWLVKNSFFKDFKYDNIKQHLYDNIDSLSFENNKRIRENITFFIALYVSKFVLCDINISKYVNLINTETIDFSKVSTAMQPGFWLQKGFTKQEAVFKCKSQRSINKEYWIYRGYTINESIEKVKELQLKNCNKFHKKLKDNPENYKDINTNQIGYWVKKGFSEKESKLKVSERQNTFTLDKCIEKYGFEEGIKRYNKRQSDWKKKLFDNGFINTGFSEMSIKLFEEIISNLKDIDISKENILYKENEKFICDEATQKCCKYDFTILSLKKIIEFNGDFWHMNPKLYESSKINRVKKVSAKQIWEYDIYKINLAKSQGFQILTIWESELNENKEELINKCLEFIYGIN